MEAAWGGWGRCAREAALRESPLTGQGTAPPRSQQPARPPRASRAASDPAREEQEGGGGRRYTPGHRQLPVGGTGYTHRESRLSAFTLSKPGTGKTNKQGCVALCLEGCWLCTRLNRHCEIMKGFGSGRRLIPAQEELPIPALQYELKGLHYNQGFKM